MNKKFFFNIFLLLCLSPALFAEGIKLNSFVDKASATTDDEIKFTITLNHPQNVEVNIPDVGPLILGLSINQFGDKKPETIKDIVLKEKWFILKANISGTYQLPAIEITSNNETFKTSPIFVEFKEPNAESKNDSAQSDIRDIKNIYLTPTSYFWPILIALLLSFILGSFYYYKYHFKKRSTSITIPAHETAFNELIKIKKIEFNTREEAKLFSFKISEIIRIYFEALLNINVTDKTTGEIKRTLPTHPNINDQHQKCFIKLLEDTDLIKFTDILPDNSQKSELYNLAYTLIEETKPKVIESQEDLV